MSQKKNKVSELIKALMKENDIKDVIGHGDVRLSPISPIILSTPGIEVIKSKSCIKISRNDL